LCNQLYILQSNGSLFKSIIFKNNKGVAGSNHAESRASAENFQGEGATEKNKTEK